MAREMKNSGTNWLDNIPADWQVIPLKILFSFGKGLNITKADLVEEGLPVISYGQIHSKKNTGTNISEELIRYVPQKLASPQSLVKQGNFIFADTSEDLDGCGNCVYMNLNSILFAGYHTIILRQREKSNDNRYLAYLFKTGCWRKQIRTVVNGVKLFTISQNILKRTSVIFPPLSEQKAIADFLDEKCAEIDGLLEDLDAEVKTLTEYKKSLIAETVTHGLNPNVPMKDSGIPWVPYIPNHWQVVANKYVMHKKKEIVPVYEGQDIISLSMSGVIVRDLDAGGKMPSSFNGYQHIYPGNLLMCLFDIDVTPRCIGLINNEGLTSPAYSQFEMDKEAYAPYYYYFYLKMDNTKELVHLSKNMRHSLNEEQFGMIKTIKPPIKEQKDIANYLDKKCAAIDQSIADKSTQIETLKAYKASLIYEYVTGKKQVI